MSARTELRISDAEREQAVAALGEHYLAGRLTKDEYDERTATAWAARTMSALAPLFADLPSLQQQRVADAATARPGPRRGSRARRLLLAIPAFWLAVSVLVLLVVAGAPWWITLILAWMLFSGMSGAFGRGCRARARHG